MGRAGGVRRARARISPVNAVDWVWNARTFKRRTQKPLSRGVPHVAQWYTTGTFSRSGEEVKTSSWHSRRSSALPMMGNARAEHSTRTPTIASLMLLLALLSSSDALRVASKSRLSRREGLCAATAAAAVAAAAPYPATAAEPPLMGVHPVLVAGATGRTGREVVQALRKRGDPFLAISGVKTETVAKIQRDAGLEAIVADLTDESATKTIAAEMRRLNVTDVVCTVGFVPTVRSLAASSTQSVAFCCCATRQQQADHSAANPLSWQYVYEDDKAAARRVDYEGTVALIRAAEEAGLSGRFVLVSSLLGNRGCCCMIMRC